MNLPMAVQRTPRKQGCEKSVRREIVNRISEIVNQPANAGKRAIQRLRNDFADDSGFAKFIVGRISGRGGVNADPILSDRMEDGIEFPSPPFSRRVWKKDLSALCKNLHRADKFFGKCNVILDNEQRNA